MQAATVEEYRFIRTEMDAVKSCITTYTGYVLGGAGAAVLGLAAVYHVTPSGGIAPALTVAVGCFALSILPTLVFSVLLYKFHSHNRYAAYCRVLGNEQPVSLPGVWEHVMPWEYCMGTLRLYDSQPVAWGQAWNEARFGGKDTQDARKAREKYGSASLGANVRWRVDEDTRTFWLRALIPLMLAKVETRSWAFPGYITALFAWITFLFLAAGVGFAGAAARGYELSLSSPFASRSILLVVGLVIVCWQAWVWRKYTHSVNAVLHGSATVNAYSWRLLPFRARFLNAIGVEPKYVLLTDLQ